MEKYLFIFILIPLCGFLINTFVHKSDEKRLAQVAFSSMALQFVAALWFTLVWFTTDHRTLYTKKYVLYNSDVYELFANFCFDNITALYLMVGAMLSFLITAYSRTYLHREGGYKRFFNTIMFFYLGYNILVLSGNFATFFIGWEVAGISSFLLIGFYRNRYLPVRNAVKVFSIYRIGDAALILAIWASHHLWHKSISFTQFDQKEAILEHITHHQGLSIFFCIMILIAAAIKSAQIPFSSWLPRAMEGPTPSSAIFYSSLSVHAGLLLLLRTYPFWEELLPVKIAVIIIGGLTHLIGSATARVQPTIKAQIAYATVAQVGLMFIEAAFGLEWLVLIHFAGNAFFRSYQLLVSPSVVTYMIREQFFKFAPFTPKAGQGFFGKIRKTIYVLCLKEWMMDEFMHHSIWNFFKIIGKRLKFISPFSAVALVASAVIMATFLVIFKSHLEPGILYGSSVGLCTAGLLFSIRSFTEKRKVYLVLGLSAGMHAMIASGVVLSERAEWSHITLYLAGVIVSGITAALSLRRLTDFGVRLNIKWYQGHAYEHPKMNLLFLISCLGLIGFPVTTTFLGIELIYGYIKTDQIILLIIISIGLLVNSLSLIRIYSRIFLGPHIRTYHETARKSA